MDAIAYHKLEVLQAVIHVAKRDHSARAVDFGNVLYEMARWSKHVTPQQQVRGL